MRGTRSRLRDVAEREPNFKVLREVGPDGKNMVEVAGVKQTWTWALERGFVSEGGSLAYVPTELSLPQG